MDPSGFSESNFVLGRVHVDIDMPRIQFKKNHISRVSTIMENILIALSDGMA